MEGVWIRGLGLTAVAGPVLMLGLLGVASLVGRPLGELGIRRLSYAVIGTSLLAVSVILAMMLLEGTRHEAVALGDWVEIPGYHFTVKLVFDRLSVPLAILTCVLCGTVARFSNRYLHRERGYNRFFVLFSLFLVGMLLTCLAGTVETLFFGWELVGLSSALLVAYFQERPAPVRNGLWVWSVYRVSDAALLVAAVMLHRLGHTGDFAVLFGAAWPEGTAAVSGAGAVAAGLLLLAAAAGKSSLVPFSGWLPRAMEGPTPSSAIFYGALSVHLGAFLLLRASPLLQTSAWLAGVVVALGLATAVQGWLIGSVQADIKSALAYASLVQVGLIVAEIGLGWHYLALLHLLGHACLRTLQFIRAPSLLHDYHQLENAVGEHLSHPPWRQRWLPLVWQEWWYRLGLERGYWDGLLERSVVGPVVGLFRWLERQERRCLARLRGGTASPELVATPADWMETVP